VASNGSTGEGRLYIQQEVADGGGTSTVTNISLFPTGSIVIGESHTMGRASALTGDKSYKHIIGNSNNVRFQAGADTETGSQVTFLNFKNSGTPSARSTYVNGRFAIGEGANSFNINNSVISIDGYDITGGTAGDIHYTACANVKTLYLDGVTTGRGFRIKTGAAADAGNVVFRPNESGSSGTTSSANYLGMNIRMFAAGNTSESTTPNIKLTGADGSIVAKEYDFVSEGVFKTPYGFKLLNGSSATEAINLDTALNLTLTLQSGPSINGNRLTWNTASKSTGQVDIYATGNATKNNFNFQGGQTVAGATPSVSIMELERDTSFASNSQKIVTIHGGIIMDGVGATTNNNAYRTENAITFNNGTANGVALIHKIGNTGADGNYVHIAGKTNADGTNGALSGKYTVVKIGRDASNKMDAQFAWNDTTDGVTPGTQTIWNQKVAQSFGAVTATSATYDTDGNITAATIPGDVEYSGTLTAPTPTADAHLATKAYVDSHSNGISGGQSNGTFTATLDGPNAPSSKQTISAHYLKTGKLVHITMHKEGIDLTNYANEIRITGLPFKPDPDISGGYHIGKIHGVNFMVNNAHADDGMIAVATYDATYGNHIEVYSEQVTQKTHYLNNNSARVTISITYISE
jgi:hypothetical protein